MRPEWLSLILNVSFVVYYTWRWQEPGRILYWLGATLLTCGLLRMKG